MPRRAFIALVVVAGGLVVIPYAARLAVCGGRGCPESEFELLPDSRLPKWLTLAAGQSRSDVSVKLRYYTSSSRSDDAVLDLISKDGQRIEEIVATSCWHPAIDKIPRNEHGGFDSEEPRYVIVRKGEEFELVDHPAGGPVFRISDDATLLTEAKNSLDRGECRKE